MSRQPEQRNAQLPRWWVRLCQWLWSQRAFIWGTLIVGIVVSVAATWLTSSTPIFTSTPLGTILLWIRDHVLLAGFIGVSLLLLTLLVGAVSHQADTSTLPPAPASGQQQNRHAFIHLLRQEYRRQLAESLQGAAMMTLALQARTDVVLSSVSLVSWRVDAPGGGPLPAPTSIVQAYDDASSGLLILGTPGAGKSTLLRELASELLTRAEQDAAQPVPVIVNLSSWASKKLPLTTWLVDQLQLVYAVPRHLSQAWIEQDQLLLLLDGLDEVLSSARSDCMEAINAYRAEHFVPLVVCSRSREYLEQEGRLRLPVAVEVRPLTPEQVDTYLEGVGKPLAAVRAALRGNAALRDLVTTPLMLSVVMLAYRGKTVKELPQLGSAEQQQRQVFDSYVTRMLEQQTRKWHYTSQQTRRWLIWLAQQMQQRSLTEFYLERLQPSWLLTKRAQIVHKVLVVLVVGLVASLVIGLLGGLVYGLYYLLRYGLVVGLIGDMLGYGLRGGLGYGLLGGLLGGLVDVLLGGLNKSQIQPSEKVTWSWNLFLQGLFGGLVVVLVVGLVALLLVRLIDVLWDTPLLRLVILWGRPLLGLVILLVFGLLFWLRRKSRTQPSEKVRWSWNAFLQGLFGGLFGGLFFGLIGELAPGLLIGLLCGGLLGGLSDRQVDEHKRLSPNQGIQTSGWNALRSVLLLGLVPGLAAALVIGPPNGLNSSLPFGLLFGLFIGLVRGGLAYLQHYCLRFLLYRNRAMPWRYVRFLEEATERILLKRVGGGFSFIHELFQDYFASLGTPSPPPSVPSPLSEEP